MKAWITKYALTRASWRRALHCLGCRRRFRLLASLIACSERTDMCDSGDFPKKPRLFYWEDAEDAWCPAEGLEVENIIGTDLFMSDGEIIKIKFKRMDMTDAEFEAIPED